LIRALVALVALAAGAAFVSASSQAQQAEGPSRFACLDARRPVITRVGADTVRYCGTLSPDGARRLGRSLRETDTTIEIVSYGGELDGPLDVAWVVLDRGLTVRVIGPCFSGCASFVFAAGSQREFGAGGFLGLHNTATGVLAALDLWPEALLRDPERGPLRARANREAELYRRRGVSVELLVDPLRRIELQCLVKAGRHPRTREHVILLGTRWSLWSPSREQLAGYNISFSGPLPETQAEVDRIFRDSAPALAESGYSIRFDVSEVARPLLPLAACSQ
jgi:hypothetical protein